MEPVRSPRNQRVAAAARLRRVRERRSTGLTLLEGPNLLEAAARGGAEVLSVFALAEDAAALTLAEGSGYELTVVTEAVLDRLAPSQHPRGPVAVMAVPSPVVIEDRNAVVLWGIGDPGNAGTLIRTAAAFGFGVVFGPGSVDPWNPKVLRAAAGAHFSAPIESGLETVADLERRGFRTVASVVGGGVAPTSIEPADRSALFIGDEANGLPDSITDACHLHVTIPMNAGLESLNASVAGSILMYELAARH